MTKCITYDKRGKQTWKEIKREIEKEKGQTNIDKRGGGGKSQKRWDVHLVIISSSSET